MTKQSIYLVALAQQISQLYCALPALKAAMVTGSAAKGLSDNYSDLDLVFYYLDELPGDEALTTARQAVGGSGRKWLLGDRAENAFVEAYDLSGIEIQIVHTTIASWEASMHKVLSEFDCETPLQKAMEGMLACQALYGKFYIDSWKAQIAAYPPLLAEAMVKKHLTFFPMWGLEAHFRTRDATLWFVQTLVDIAQNIIGVLAGLNHLYFTTFQLKRMGTFLQQMKIAPLNLATRIERFFQAEIPIALNEVESLVAETIQLVEHYMPQIDTSQAKRRLGWRQVAWEARPS